VRILGIALLLLLVLLGLLGWMMGQPAASGTIYTPSRLAQVLSPGYLRAARPRQDFRVRGVLDLWHVGPRGKVYFLSNRGGGGTLIVLAGPPNSLLAALRRLPVVGSAVPPTPDQPITGQRALYHIKIRVCLSPCATSADFRLQLLDGGRS